MAVIQYFVPNIDNAGLCREDGSIVRDALGERGMLHALRDIASVPRDATLTGVRNGPGEADGILITPTRADGEVKQCCYVPDRQEWREAENGKYWLGIDHSDRFQPLDVQRRKVFFGFNICADDGMPWLVPIARSDDASRVTLPQDIRFRDGRPVVTLRKQYMELWEIAEQIVRWCAGEAEADAADRDWRINAALTALNINYRVWKDEINLAADIGQPILSTDILDAVCLSIADIQFAVEVKKKGLLESGRELFDSGGSSIGTGDGSSMPLVGAS